jgi:D-alanyl-D-alanine carboxypeptidase/D-alanyl-D-alanine-endopeptidase (penicillin-binding protein 4)
MLTPRSLVAVLKQTEKHVNWETLQILFPKSGSSGTLKAYTQLKDVYAKTGTLRHNHNLSGYWESPKGNRYAFSIMVNHFTAPTAEIRKGISTLLNRIQKKLK